MLSQVLFCVNFLNTKHKLEKFLGNSDGPLEFSWQAAGWTALVHTLQAFNRDEKVEQEICVAEVTAMCPLYDLCIFLGSSSKTKDN